MPDLPVPAPVVDVIPWPESHRDVLRSVVRIAMAERGSGTGLMVGPDVVMTCRHVAKELEKKPGENGEQHRERLESVKVHVGIPPTGSGNNYIEERFLNLTESDDPDCERPWLCSMPMTEHDAATAGDHRPAFLYDGEEQLDFAFLRLRSVAAGKGAKYEALRPGFRVENPLSVPENARGRFFMYHFPADNAGAGTFVPVLSLGDMSPETDIDTATVTLKRCPHTFSTNCGSSGAVIFYEPRGKRPVPAAMHTVGYDDGTGGATELYSVLDAVLQSDRQFYDELTLTPSERDEKLRLREIAQPVVRMVQQWIDRDTVVMGICSDRAKGGKIIHPLLVDRDCGADALKGRLWSFELPAVQPPSDFRETAEVRKAALQSMVRPSKPTHSSPAEWQTLHDIPLSADLTPAEWASQVLNAVEENAVYSTPTLIAATVDLETSSLTNVLAFLHFVSDRIATLVVASYPRKPGPEVFVPPFHVLLQILVDEKTGMGERLSINDKLKGAMRARPEEYPYVANPRILDPIPNIAATERWISIVKEALDRDADKVAEAVSRVFSTQTPIAFSTLVDGLEANIEEWVTSAIKQNQ